MRRLRACCFVSAQGRVVSAAQKMEENFDLAAGSGYLDNPSSGFDRLTAREMGCVLLPLPADDAGLFAGPIPLT